MKFPSLQTQRLRLDKLELSDADHVFELFSDKEVLRFYDLQPLQSKQESEALIDVFLSRYDNKAGIRWAIRHRGTGDFIGTCGFNAYLPWDNTNIGYDIRQGEWAKGYATEAVAAISRFAFQGGLPAKVNRIEALTIPGNIASEKVLLKCGYEFEGLLREKACLDNRYVDMKMFSLLNTENK